MKDRYGIPIRRDVPLSGDRLRSNPESSSEWRPFSKGHWQRTLFLSAGLVAAILLSNALVRSVAGLSTSAKPTATRQYEVPSFASLVECNAHFSHEILRIKNKMPAHNTAADLPLMHRNYRRLHRLMRQVGRRDGIPSDTQTQRLRNRVNQLNGQAGASAAAGRDATCRAMANMPIARKRHSQRIVGN